MDFERLIESIYDAAVAPELWPSILDQLAVIADAEGTILFSAHNEKTRTISSRSIEENVARSLTPEWICSNERTKRLGPMSENRFRTDLDAFTLEELDTIPYYRDFLRPSGLGWCAVTTIHMPTGDSLVLSIERAHKKGPIQPSAVNTLDLLRPHLVRAAGQASRTSLSRAQSSVFALESVGLAAAVLSDKGKVLAANTLILDNAPGITVSIGDLLKFQDHTTQERFWELMPEDGASADMLSPSSLILRSDRHAKPYIAHLFPFGDAGNDVFTGASALFYLVPLAGNATMPIELLQGMFDLTPAEAKIAKLIGKGSTISDISNVLNVQESTVRVHLKSIFIKTGVNRQSELVRLTTMTTGGHDID